MKHQASENARDTFDPSSLHEATHEPSHKSPLGDFQVGSRVLVLMAMAVAVGFMGAGAAWLLSKLIILATNIAWFGVLSLENLSLRDAHPGLAHALIPAAGGLIIGLMARYGSEKIRGHGIPEAIEAILIGGSRIQPRVAVLKPLSSAVSIGSGGPFGAEGPVIMTGGALGSLFAQLFHMSAPERKTLLVAGAAAGMTGIFGTPVAAVLLAVELMLFEWRPRSFLPVATAAVIAAVCRMSLFPAAPLFPFTAVADVSWTGLGSWVVVGVVAGFGSAALTAMVYGAEDAFARLPFHWMWWPAIGGIVVGVGGLIEPAALGVGYDNLQAMLQGSLSAQQLAILLLVKAVIWAVALGSGTSGGVLAPLLIIGGALGGLEGMVLAPDHPMMFALLGMAAMMGGTMRSPLTATIFAVELTGNFHMMLPLITACAAAHVVTVLILKRSILTERIARRGHHVLREYSVDPFDMARVGEIMIRDVDFLRGSMTLEEAVDFFTTEDPRHKSYPVIDDRHRVLGMVSRADILRWTMDEDFAPTTLAAAVGTRQLLLGHPDEMAGQLADRMAKGNIGRVPIVLREDRRLVGIVARKDLLHVRARLASHEQQRSAPLRSRSADRV